MTRMRKLIQVAVASAALLVFVAPAVAQAEGPSWYLEPWHEKLAGEGGAQEFSSEGYFSLATSAPPIYCDVNGSGKAWNEYGTGVGKARFDDLNYNCNVVSTWCQKVTVTNGENPTISLEAGNKAKVSKLRFYLDFEPMCQVYGFFDGWLEGSVTGSFNGEVLEYSNAAGLKPFTMSGEEVFQTPEGGFLTVE